METFDLKNLENCNSELRISISEFEEALRELRRNRDEKWRSCSDQLTKQLNFVSLCCETTFHSKYYKDVYRKIANNFDNDYFSHVQSIDMFFKSYLLIYRYKLEESY